MNRKEDCICYNCRKFRHLIEIKSKIGPDCACKMVPFYNKKMCSVCECKEFCDVFRKPYVYDIVEDDGRNPNMEKGKINMPDVNEVERYEDSRESTRKAKILIMMKTGMEAMDHFQKTGERNKFREWAAVFSDEISEDSQIGLMTSELDDFSKKAAEQGRKLKEALVDNIKEKFSESIQSFRSEKES